MEGLELPRATSRTWSRNCSGRITLRRRWARGWGHSVDPRQDGAWTAARMWLRAWTVGVGPLCAPGPRQPHLVTPRACFPPDSVAGGSRGPGRDPEGRGTISTSRPRLEGHCLQSSIDWSPGCCEREMTLVETKVVARLFPGRRESLGVLFMRTPGWGRCIQTLLPGELVSCGGPEPALQSQCVGRWPCLFLWRPA